MKKFSWYILSLCALMAGLLYLLDIIYTTAHRNGIPRNKVAYVLSMENEQIDYVFLGSSRVDNTIDADVIEEVTGKRAINLGIQGAKINDSYIMLQLLERQNIKMEVVFVQVDYSYNLKGTSEILKSSIMPYLKDEKIGSYVEHLYPNYITLRNIPFYRYMKFDYKMGFREVFNTSIGKASKTDFSNGYFPKYGSSGVKLEAVLPEVINPENSTIQAIDQFAAEHDIKIVYFFSPYCPNTGNLDFVEKLEKKLRPFWEFTDEFPSKEEYFFDCGHLNDSGAKEFSRLFAKRINRNLQ